MPGFLDLILIPLEISGSAHPLSSSLDDGPGAVRIARFDPSIFHSSIIFFLFPPQEHNTI